MRKLLLLTALVLGSVGAWAQVTTSSIVGQIRDDKGSLPGATIVAVHEPSGSKYGTATNVDGRFTLPNVRIGGPYTIEVSFVGYQTSKVGGITLKLGQSYVHNIQLAPESTQLGEITIVGDKSQLNTERTGAVTNISSAQLGTLPTISRSITDFTRLTPQANGNSFGGRDGRYNNIQVDGANLNNNFGLSNDPLPGGGGSPISIDAYDEISVNIAPFDVRQAGFTGAGINAVTKSGTNTFKGTAYTLFRNQNYIGTNVGDNDISSQIVDSKTNIYGFSIGGPIIKDKLFFFVNAEQEKGSRPGITFSPTGGSGSGVVSSTPIDSLRKFSDHLRNVYNYETGAFDNFPNFENENTKLLVKLDYNINKDHRLTLKYSNYVSTNDQPLNATSVPNGGGFDVTGRTNISRLPVGRFSNASMSFANSNYGFEDKVNTATLELNSNFNGKFSNQLLGTITKVNTTRTFDGSFFPTIDIFDGSGDNYMSAGMDPFTPNNQVVNDVYTFTNNLSYYKGNHTITAGVSYEFQRVGNMFMAASNSYYAFNSLNDFITNQSPAYYAYTYSLVPGQKSVFSAELNVGQLGIYAQDEISLGNLKITAGIRADRAFYTEDPIENPATSAQQFYDKDGNLTNYSTGEWPKSPFLLSPRVGVRWDVNEDQSLVVRGGTGLFTGRIPFVFLTNMPTNSAMYQFGGRLDNSVAADVPQLSGITFSSNPDAYASLFPTTAGTSPSRGPVFIDPDFKFPQVWRTNVAVDKSLPYGLTATFEALITKDVNAVRMRNANFRPTMSGVVTEGGLTRPRYLPADGRDLNATVNSAIVLENTNKGYSTSLTAQLTKSFDKGFAGSLAYTYTKAEEVTANPGSQAASVWNSNPNVGSSNAVELANSQYAVPHRIIANVSYRKEYAKYFASTLSLFYEGSHQGVYSFVVSGDINGDGNSSTDLMYIPRDASEMNFVEYTASVSGQPVTFTVAQQEAAFEQFINNSNYLKNNRGKFAERNSALLPWYNTLDLRFLQEFFLTTGKNSTKHTLQLSVDIFNFSNMLNKNWGIRQFTRTRNPLTSPTLAATPNATPTYRLQQIGGELVTDPFQDAINTGSTWSMQVGLRYIF
ncbi:hypothetical protein SanaruYs_28500 [Chryseotalea sanaruensis]|uniref:TonB-dependent transporter Oar-like beta-barrel domain-containing protein n=1 Tax=Chryseotalea sanaruensis TaxID=2482724 RepID=A0A401UCK2_9BACT|nr:TonB-dependent receptor [Chryseotalea sanaruensis]GCC52613.1 hypothetical protein SanaruYs_28500 [Chryseotalea sanaruensis]